MLYLGGAYAIVTAISLNRYIVQRVPSRRILHLHHNFSIKNLYILNGSRTTNVTPKWKVKLLKNFDF